MITPLARPRTAGLVALVIYLLRARLSDNGLQHTTLAHFNFLADAFLHGQLGLRLPAFTELELTPYRGQVHIPWLPFPAVVMMPLVALFGVTVSDVMYTAVLGALTVAVLAKLLIALEQTGVAPLTVQRRSILVTTSAFGSVLLILAPVGGASSTTQITGLLCVLLATLATMTQGGKRAYFLTGLALACATATRLPLLMNGVWLAYYLLWRDRQQPWPQRLTATVLGLAPVLIGLLLVGWYNWARFGSPLEAGHSWNNMASVFRPDFERYGTFSLHYLPRNLYYQFIAYNLGTPAQWHSSGLFWMTPVFLGAPYAVWQGRCRPLVWALVLSCILVYLPIAFFVGSGFLTFGPRYLLDLMVPIVVLTALGIQRWPLLLLMVLLMVSGTTYLFGSWMWWLYVLPL